MKTKKKKNDFEEIIKEKKSRSKQPKYRITKLSVGVVSCIIGWTMCFGNTGIVKAEGIQPNAIVLNSEESTSEPETITTEDPAKENNTTEAKISDDEKAKVINATVSALKSIDYDTNEKISGKLASKQYRMTEILYKKVDIFKKTGKKIADITDAEAIAELNKENPEVELYRNTFKDIQKDIESVISKLLDTSSTLATNREKNSEYYVNKITSKKEELLLGLTYIDRLYDFKFGDKNLKDILIYNPSTYGKTVDPIDWLIEVGSLTGADYQFSNNLNTFNKIFVGKITDDRSLTAFLESNKNKFIPNKSMNEWFKEASKAFIVEGQSKENPNINVGLYTKLASEERTKSHILPLLTVPENSIYAISNSASITYGLVDTYVNRNLKTSNPNLYKEKIKEFEEKLKSASDSQSEFIDFWYRIGKENLHGLLKTNRIVIDSHRLYTDSYTYNTQNEWSPKSGDKASIGIKEFIVPLNMYGNYLQADGQAEGTGIRFFLAKALEERGLSTYTHEMTHHLEKSVWMNNFGKRDGLDSEFYARGLYESYYLNDPIFNINLIFNKESDDRYQNSSPTRFQDENDVQQYMKGLFDVLYTLDYAEADVVLQKDIAIKQKWFNKLEQVDGTRVRFNKGEGNSVHKIDKFSNISMEEAGQLTDINSLIDNNIIASRYEFMGRDRTGVAESNGYYVVPLFSPIYAGVQNNQGVSGDIITRRLSYELLAEYGYYNGLVPYISNQYKVDATNEGKVLSDEYILNKIFNGKYKNMAEFKKAMFAERINNTDKLTTVTINWNNQNHTIDSFDKLKELMTQAVNMDLANPNTSIEGYSRLQPKYTEVEKLKAAIFKAYLKSTNDFETSIYKSPSYSEQYTVTDGTVAKEYGQTATENEIKNAITKNAPDDKVKSVDISGAIPTTGKNNIIEVTVTYTDDTVDKAKVTLSYKDASNKYSPTAKTIEVEKGATVKAEDVISNKDTLPQNTKYAWKNTLNTNTAGTINGVVVITYPDSSKDEVTVNIKVNELVQLKVETYAEKYTAIGGNINKEYGQIVTEYEIKNAIIIDAPKDKIKKIDVLSNIPTMGRLNMVETTVTYTDNSTDKVIVTVMYSRASIKYRPIAKVIEVQKGEIPKAEDIIYNKYSLPEGTTYSWKYTPNTSKAGYVIVTVVVTYPDLSTDEVSINIKVND